jgi:ABC-2 type transport system ATP-binding protein
MSAIRTQTLSKRFGETLALDGLDLAVEPGEVYGYLGPNGAGKTTTIRLLLGLLRPSGGQALLFGVDAWHDPVEAHRRLAFVAAEPNLWPGLTGAETLEFLARVRGGDDRTYRQSLLERFRLDADKKVRALSHGNRQKVQLIAAFASRAELLILDEPTGGLDPRQRERLWEFVLGLAGAGTTVIFSTHNIAEAERYGQRLLVLADGERIFFGDYEAFHAEIPQEDPRDFEQSFVAFLRARGH